MAQKDDLKAQLDAAGIAYEADASLAQLKALLPVDDEVGAAPVVATYDFAVNVVKLNRAKVWVAEQAKLAGTPAPVGAALIAAVKDRYVAIGGLLRDQQLAGKTKKRGPKVVNLADNDDEEDK